MDKPKHCKLVGNYPNICELQNSVDALHLSEWDKFQFRQKTIVGHKHTQTIPLIFDYQKKIRKIVHPNYTIFEKYLTDISVWLKNSGYGNEIKRANLVKLLPNSKIDKHVDQGDFLKSTNRIHVVIKTNPFCSFTVSNETKIFNMGEVWEINNTGQIHGVENNGETERIHLVVDVG